VYLACNTLPRGDEVEELPDFIRQAAAAGIDALIVADIGVLMLAKRAAPELEIHISTQAGIVNHLAATEFYRMGASRVILARELTLDEIKVIRDKTPSELAIETFVHGAMCVSFSGRCLLSQYLTGRDGNRGACTQPCRWSYRLVEEKRPGLYLPISEGEQGTNILNAQDMCLLPHLDRLAAAGISSFKIEGRAKSVYYVAVVTNAYRAALDQYLRHPASYAPPAWALEEVYKVSHREYCTGFYFPETPPTQCYQGDGYVRNWEVAATVIGVEEGRLVCQERNRFSVGDKLELLRPGTEPVELTVESILDEEGNSIPVANHPMAIIRLPFREDCSPGAMLRRLADR
jgi:putative protease